MRVLHCFFSGGRDSALACYIAHRVAKARGWGFRLVFINTTIAIPDTVNYVHTYAKWLGAELIELRPKHTFEEFATKYSWPLLWHNSGATTSLSENQQLTTWRETTGKAIW
jgi:hypothetical protein